MSVLPIDLQVLFSKASDLSESIARHSNAAQTGYVEGYEKIHKESKTTDETVKTLEEYDPSFTKVNPDTKNKQGRQNNQKKKNPEEKHDSIKEFKRAPTEEGTGRIIDIVD